MEPKHAIGLFLGVGFLGLAQRWSPSLGIAAADLAMPMPWLLFLAGAVALVALVPVAFEAGRPWPVRTAALVPGAVLFVAEQLEAALVPGGAGADLSINLALGVFVVLATTGFRGRHRSTPGEALDLEVA